MAVWLDRLRVPALILGILALLTAVVVYFITGEFGLPPRVLVVAGALLVGIYVAIEPGEVAGALGSRGVRYGGNTLLVVAVFIGLLFVINFMGIRYSQRWDTTSNRVNTLSDQSERILENLAAPVHVFAFVVPGQAAETAELLLRNYEQRSNGKLTFDIIDPENDPTKAIELGVRQVPTLVFTQGERRQETQETSESGLTLALLKVSGGVSPKVYFLTGHGERGIDTFTPDSISELRGTLRGDNYQVETLNLLTTPRVPDDAAVVVVAGPQNAFQPEEIQALEQYLDRAGRLYLLADPRAAAGIDQLVGRWGVSVGSGVVVETQPGAFLQIGGRGNPLVPVVSKYTAHAVTQPLMRLGQQGAVIMIEATTISLPTDRRPGVTITKLAETSGDRSWTRPVGADNLEFVEGEDTRGPLVLAVAIEADAPNAPPPPNADADADAPPAARPKARIVLVSDVDWATNNWLPRFPLGAKDFFVNSVNWLSGVEEQVSIRPRPQEQRTIFLSGVQRNAIFFSTVIFIPLLALAGGAAMWWSRR